jgi:hypothetical protein
VIQYWANHELWFFRPHPLPLLLLNTTDVCLQIVTQSTSSAYSSYLRDYSKLHTLHILLNTQLSELLLKNYAAKFISFEMNLYRLLARIENAPEHPDFVMRTAWFTTVVAGLFVWFCLLDKEWIWIFNCLLLSPSLSLSLYRSSTHTYTHTLTPTQTVEWEMIQYQGVAFRPM